MVLVGAFRFGLPWFQKLMKAIAIAVRSDKDILVDNRDRMTSDNQLDTFVPDVFRTLKDPARDLPRLAKDPSAMATLEAAMRRVPTRHELLLGDARHASFSAGVGPLGGDVASLLDTQGISPQRGPTGLDRGLRRVSGTTRRCLAHVPQGADPRRASRLCGWVTSAFPDGRTPDDIRSCLSTRPYRSDVGSLGSITWPRSSGARSPTLLTKSTEGAGGFLGKPYEPNAVIKNDIEFILMQRKPGGYRKPSTAARTLSLLPREYFQRLFRQVWTDIKGASTRKHPAPYPVELAERLIRMFSFVGDTVLDPFTGTASTQIAAAACGRNSVGIEVDPVYMEAALSRLQNETSDLLKEVQINTGKIAGSPAISQKDAVTG